MCGAGCDAGKFGIYSAPLLFAELLVDGLSAVRLYKRFRGIEPQHWVTIAVLLSFSLCTDRLVRCDGETGDDLVCSTAQSIGAPMLQAGVGS